MRSPLFASVALVAVFCALLSALLSAQEPKDQRHIVTVTGCVEKSWLKVVEQTDMVMFSTHVDKYHLHGTKDLMKTLAKDLNGHQVEVTGALSDPDNTQGTAKSIMVGTKTRIYTNARETSDVPPPIDPTIEVTAFRDIANTCSSSGG